MFRNIFLTALAMFAGSALAAPEIQHWHFRRFPTEPEAREWIAEAHAGWTTETSANWAVVGADDDEIAAVVSLPCL